MQNTNNFYNSCKIQISFNLTQDKQYLILFMMQILYKAIFFKSWYYLSKLEALSSEIYRDYSDLCCIFLANASALESYGVWSWLKHIHVNQYGHTFSWKDWFRQMTFFLFLWQMLNFYVGANKVSWFWLEEKVWLGEPEVTIYIPLLSFVQKLFCIQMILISPLYV